MRRLIESLVGLLDHRFSQNTAQMWRGDWRWWHAATLASLVGISCYLNSLSADFVYDDSRAIQKNADLLPTTAWTDLLSNDFWGTPLTHSGSHKSYRPLCVASFRLNYYLDGLNPRGYHLVNVLLHGVVCWMVVVLAYTLFQAHFPSLVAGLLFAAHPIHTEAVTGVVGRADVGACLFFIVALCTYIKACPTPHLPTPPLWCTNWQWLLCTLGFCLASMLTKELGITVLGVCAVYDIVAISNFNCKDLTASLKQAYKKGCHCRLLSLTVTGAVLLGLRMSLMGRTPPDFSPSDNPAANTQSFFTRCLTFLYLPAFDFGLMLCPRLLSFDWSMDAVPLVESVFDPRNIVTLVFYGFLIFLGLYSSRRISLNHCPKEVIKFEGHSNCTNGRTTNGTSVKKRTTAKQNGHHDSSNGKAQSEVSAKKTELNRELPFFDSSERRLLVSFLVSLGVLIFSFIPACNLFFYVGFVVAERVLYIPSVGFCLLIAGGTDVLWQKFGRRNRSVLVFSLIAILVLFVARTVNRNWDWHNEETLYRSGISVNPAKAWGNLGNVLGNQGRKAEAESAYKQALTYRANMADTHYNLGILLAGQKRHSEAITCYQRAIRFRPRLAVAHLNLGIVLDLVGQKRDAVKVLRNAVDISGHGLKDPKLHSHSIASIKYNLGRILLDLNQVKEAIMVFLDVVQTRPAHFEPHSLFNMLGEAYSKADQAIEAEKWYTESLRTKPDHIPVHLTFAKHLAKVRRDDEAQRWFRKAQALDRKDPAVWTHYGQFMYERNKIAEAAAMFSEAAELAPRDFDIVFSTANYLREAGDYGKAEAMYNVAVELRPDNAVAFMNLGALLHLVGKLEAAERVYLQALTLEPGNQMTRENLNKLRSLLAKKRPEKPS